MASDDMSPDELRRKIIESLLTDFPELRPRALKAALQLRPKLKLEVEATAKEILHLDLRTGSQLTFPWKDIERIFLDVEERDA